MATFVGNPAATALTGAEIVPISQGGVDKRTTAQQIADANESKSADIASATTTDLSTAATPYVHVTGTTTITGLGTAQAGTARMVVFDGILTLTHNATSLILPTGANITTATGDAAIFRSEGTGNWRCVAYQRADGTPLAGGGGGGTYTGTAGSITLTGSAFSIDATYVGQASITTLGTITAGTWNATAIGATKGGTGQTGYAVGDLLYASSTTALSKLAVGTDGYVLTLASGVPTWAAASGGGGGLTNWTEAVHSSSPNATIPVVSFTATNAATNVDAAIRPKGNGAVSAQVADSTTTGGNKRGRNAVDWQTGRTNSVNVASGDYSVIGGGNNNLSNSTYSTVGGGNGNKASNSIATVGGGSSNTASGSLSTVAGGSGNTASGANSYVGGGAGNTASGDYSAVLGGQNGSADADLAIIIGGRNATARTCRGAMARAATTFLVTAGDTQVRDFIFLADTTNNTPEPLTTNNATAGSTNSIILPNNSVYVVRGYVSARQQSTGDIKAWSFEVAIKRNASAAATSIVGTPTITVIAADAGLGSTNAAGSIIALSADTTLGGLALTITGETSKSIKWAAKVRSLENVTA